MDEHTSGILTDLAAKKFMVKFQSSPTANIPLSPRLDSWEKKRSVQAVPSKSCRKKASKQASCSVCVVLTHPWRLQLRHKTRATTRRNQGLAAHTTRSDERKSRQTHGAQDALSETTKKKLLKTLTNKTPTRHQQDTNEICRFSLNSQPSHMKCSSSTTTVLNSTSTTCCGYIDHLLKRSILTTYLCCMCSNTEWAPPCCT